MAVTVDADYAMVLFWTAAIAAELWAMAGLVSLARKKAKLPYPDCGNGRFSAKLSDKDWVDFNCAQRVHLNFVEGAVPIVVSLLVAGIFFPVWAARFGAAYFFGRVAYAIGYISSGPKGRVVGVVLQDVALVVLIFMSLYGSLQAAKVL